jgi:hypothetical protein
MTERHAAIHAAGSLLLQFLDRHVFVELVPIENPQVRIPLQRRLPDVLFETSRLTHLCYHLLRWETFALFMT